MAYQKKEGFLDVIEDSLISIVVMFLKFPAFMSETKLVMFVSISILDVSIFCKAFFKLCGQ